MNTLVSDFSMPENFVVGINKRGEL